MIELLHNAGSSSSLVPTSSSKLHFQIRIKASLYRDSRALHDAAEKIVTSLRDRFFPNRLIAALEVVGPVLGGHANQSRFGWLFTHDVQILSAVALPIGDIRDPYGDGSQSDGSSSSKGGGIPVRDLLLIGVALGALVAFLFVLYLHYRLRQEYALISKDKSTLTKSSETLRRLWTRFAAMARGPRQGNGEGREPGTSAGAEWSREIEMGEMGSLMSSHGQDND